MSRLHSDAARGRLDLRTLRRLACIAAAFVVLALVPGGARAQGGPAPLPPVPVPSENPISEEKRLLGKVLFWDEQVSGDNTVACGTCHSLGRSGTEARPPAIHPGLDEVFGTPDDVRASFGVVHADVNGTAVVDELFGLNRQVTRRSANSAVNAGYPPELFWDGRAGQTFLDPDSGQVSIAVGGALENQAIGPILSSVEMGRDARTWAQVTAKLAVTEPLAQATALPPDVALLVASHPTYADLFQSAFGDPAITAERIAHAIATYERTLVANQTPWDRFIAGDQTALTQGQQAGWNTFRGSPCAACHTPPLFSNNTFRVIGVRPTGEDTGRQEVTGLAGDRGRFKVPSLRGVGRKTTFMHNGQFATLQQVIGFYAAPPRFPDNLDPLMPVPLPPPAVPAVIDFLANGLTDPRVAAETAPFDRPTLHGGAVPALNFAPDKTTMNWPPLLGVASYQIFRGDLAGLVDANHDGLPDAGYGTCVTGDDPNPADAQFVDPTMPDEGGGFFYLKAIVDGGTVRGLGVTSAGKLRVPGVACP